MWIARLLARPSRQFEWRSYFLFGCAILLAVLLAGASFNAHRSSQDLAAVRERQVHSLDVLLAADELRMAALQQVRGERGFLLTSDASLLDPFVEGRDAAGKSFARLIELTADNPEQQQRLLDMRDEFGAFNTVLDAVIAQQKSGRREDAIFYIQRGNDKDALEAVLHEVDALADAERALLIERGELADLRAVSNERLQYVLASIGVLFLLLTAVTILFLRRSLARGRGLENELERVSATDALTSLPNRQKFIDALARAISVAETNPKQKFALAIFDVDHFKRINDRCGHEAGDEVIREVGNRAMQALREQDFVGRISGEEFAVLLPGADLDKAHLVCERMRAAIAVRPVTWNDGIIPFTASFGVAEFRTGDDIDHIMVRADTALYEAKVGGRNQVRLAA